MLARGPRWAAFALPCAPCCVRLAKKYALCWLRCALAPFLRSNLAVGPRFCSLGRSPGPDLPCLNERFASSYVARARATRCHHTRSDAVFLNALPRRLQSVTHYSCKRIRVLRRLPCVSPLASHLAIGTPALPRYAPRSVTISFVRGGSGFLELAVQDSLRVHLDVKLRFIWT